jgi:predicted ester cyclase
MAMPAAERLARDFFRRVWAPPHELDAIDALMTEDYRITTAGTVVEGRAAFKRWVGAMQATIGGVTNEHLEIIVSAAGDRVVSRFVTRGTNNGIFGLPADGRTIEFSGIALWRVEGDRLAECWVERSAFELHRALTEGVAR